MFLLMSTLFNPLHEFDFFTRNLTMKELNNFKIGNCQQNTTYFSLPNACVIDRYCVLLLIYF